MLPTIAIVGILAFAYMLFRDIVRRQGIKADRRERLRRRFAEFDEKQND